MTPLVSVCVLSMNHGAYVEQCLESVEQQTYENIELLFLDNASSDNTFELASRFLGRSRLRVTMIERRQVGYNIPANFNRQVARANGRYGCFVSADDWLAPDNIQKKVELIRRKPDIAIVYSPAYTVHEATGEIVKEPFPNLIEGTVFDDLVKQYSLSTPGWLLDLEKVTEVGGFNENFAIEDWDLALRLSKKYKVAVVNEFLVYYRRHASNASCPTNPAHHAAKLAIIEQYKRHPFYRESRQRIVFEQFRHLTEADPNLNTLLLTLRIQDGSVYRLRVLLHNIKRLWQSIVN